MEDSHSSRNGEQLLKVMTANEGKVFWTSASIRGDLSIKLASQGRVLRISSYSSKEATAPTGTVGMSILYSVEIPHGRNSMDEG